MTLTAFSTSQEAQQAAALLEGYHFDLGRHESRQWVSLWLELYRPLWIRDAVIEALYQGRYKAFSVRQILELWQKRGQPIRHSTHDFEATVCRDYGGAKLAPVAQPVSLAPPTEPVRQKASRRIHQSLSSISFNLSELAGYPDATYPEVARSSAQEAGGRSNAALGQLSRNRSVDADSPIQPVARKAFIETAETLQAQQQLSTMSSSSSRAIQPFKPALPFSAQTLRLAKQKSLAIAESR